LLADDVWLGLRTGLGGWKRRWVPCSVVDKYADVEDGEFETGDDGLGEEVEDNELSQQL